MQTASAAPHGLCEICRGCVGDTDILFDTGNKTNLSRQSDELADTPEVTNELMQPERVATCPSALVSYHLCKLLWS